MTLVSLSGSIEIAAAVVTAEESKSTPGGSGGSGMLSKSGIEPIESGSEPVGLAGATDRVSHGYCNGSAGSLIVTPKDGRSQG